jgi:glutamyl-Q tRNA(Asp) synthetase
MTLSVLDSARTPGRPYVGRFAPTPSGPLHIGSLVAAMASWLDARRANGCWLIRIEDLDRPRNVAGAAEEIIATLEAFGMTSDAAVVRQSDRLALYEEALVTLKAAGLTFACTCSRREIADSRLPDAPNALVYPGTCREGPTHPSGRHATRLRVPDEEICFHDRIFGERCQVLSRDVGDFVIRRADGVVTYQLAVVVDDGAQRVNHVVRGADLIDSTPRQIYLQRCLDLVTPSYCHVPVVTNARDEKLSKQTGAIALDRSNPVAALRQAGAFLNLGDIVAPSVDAFWREALLRYADLRTYALM